MANLNAAYWLAPSGQVLDISDGKHISEVVRAPEKFGVTKEYIEEIYKKWNEPVGFEGKARNEILTEILKKGFVRIRLYRRGGWSIEAYDMSMDTEQLIGSWAHDSLTGSAGRDETPVTVTDIKTNQRFQMPLDELAEEWFDPSEVNEHVESVFEFVTYKQSFKRFLLA